MPTLEFLAEIAELKRENERLKKQNAAFVKLIKEQALELDGTELDDDLEEIDP